MNKTISKKIRKYLLDHTEEALFVIRNEYGSLTENMDERQIYQNAKKLYKQGKLKLN